MIVMDVIKLATDDFWADFTPKILRPHFLRGFAGVTAVNI